MAESTLPLTALLESLLFVADGPVPVAQFATALESTPRAIETALEELESGYQVRGLRIQRDKSGIQLTTAPQAAEAVEKFLGLESLQRLSRPSVETLAIIAYQQPVTRPYIESIRGVNSDGVIKSLLTKGLIEEVGRTDGPGRPVLYSTTSAFLQHFGLTSLLELPPLDIESLLAAAKVTAEQNLAAEPEPTPVPAGTDGVEIPVQSEAVADSAIEDESEKVLTAEPITDLDNLPDSQHEPPILDEIDTVADPEPQSIPDPVDEPEALSTADPVSPDVVDSFTKAETAADLPTLVESDEELPADEVKPEPFPEDPAAADPDDEDDDEDADDEDDDWEDEDEEDDDEDDDAS